MDRDPPSPRQLNYLKALAQRTGQTFTWPKTSSQARREIARLKETPPSTRTEIALERVDDRASRERAEDAAAVRANEVAGFGSTATWRKRS